MTHQITHPEGLPADINLDELLGDLDFDLGNDEIIGEMPLEAQALDVIEEVIEEEVIEAVVEVPAHELSDDEAQALDLDLFKAEAYEVQENDAVIDDEIEAAPDAVIEKPKRERKVKVAGAVKPGRATKDISTLDPEHFQLIEGATTDDAMKADVMSRRPNQVKIAEKFDNMIAALAVGKAPSTYVMDCFSVLDARKEVLGSDFVAALTAHDYTIGTARSQAGQIVELFRVLGVGDRQGQKLTLRDDSAFAAKLRAIVSAALIA